MAVNLEQELARAKRTIVELKAGACRYNCATAKQQWTEGYQRAMMDMRPVPLSKEHLNTFSERAWKENK